MMDRLPRATSSFGCVVLVCPWCREDMDDATIRLTDLVNGWEGDCPDWPPRSKGGQATTPLATDCPSCSRPSMVAIVGHADGPNGDVRFVKLVPFRTPADAVMIGDEA